MQPFIGMIAMFGFNYPPLHWGYCNGATVGISQYQALYALIGTFYGGDGRVTMALPDFRSRMPVGSTVMGASPTVPGKLYALGQIEGVEEVILTQNQMPIHNHDATFTGSGGGGGTAVSVNVAVSTTDGNSGPAVAGALLSQGKVGFDPANIFQTNTSVGTVGLGGVTASGGGGGITGGVVTLNDTGLNDDVDIRQPVQAVTFSIALTGLFPSRN